MRNYRTRSSDYRNTGFALFGLVLVWLSIAVAIVGGWILNIVDLIRMSDSIGPVGEWTLVIWLKMVGIFLVPLGSFMGWFF